MEAKIPLSLAINRCAWDASAGVPVVHEALRVTVAPLDVTYTSSRPSVASAPSDGLYSSTNSSDALVPPVITPLTRSWDTAPASAWTIPAGGSVQAMAEWMTAEDRTAAARMPASRRRGNEGARTRTSDGGGEQTVASVR